MSFKLDLDHIDRRRLVPGLILITLGILGLLGSLGWLGGFGGLVGTALFGAAAYFAYQQGQRTGALGWRVAVFPLAGLAIAGITPDPIGGAAFLSGLGIAFVLVYREDPRRWWAIIPAGALLAMALTAVVEDGARGGGGAAFLLGLAATFFVLTRLPGNPQRWAIYPAAALALLAVLALTTGGSWVVPVVLIAIGAWMLLKPETAREVRDTVARTVREATAARPAAHTEASEPASNVEPVPTAANAAPESAPTAPATQATAPSSAPSDTPAADEPEHGPRETPPRDAG